MVLTSEFPLDGLSHRESALDTLARRPDSRDGGLGRLLAVLLLRSRGVRGPASVAVRSTTTVIGRGNGAGIVLPHASVSDAHAELRLRGAVWTLADLDSQNGTWVDGEPVLGALPLAPGSELRLGEVVLAFNPRDRWEDSADVIEAVLPLVGHDGIDTQVADVADVAPSPVATPGVHPPRAIFSGYGYEAVAPPSSRRVPGWIIVGIAALAVVLFLLFGIR